MAASTSELTRGDLSPGSIKNTSSGKEVKFHFNPHEFSISKSNTWESRAGQGNDLPSTHFKEGGPQSLSLSLHFDTQRDGKAVTTVTNDLWKMMLTDSSNANQTTGKSQPPVVEFKWGPMAFKAIITQMSEKFVLFSAGGYPLRSVVDISLQQYVGEDASADELGFSMSNTTVPTTKTITSSDRIDNVAAEMTGSSSNWKDVAAQNNMSDPLKPVTGSTMGYKK